MKRGGGRVAKPKPTFLDEARPLVESLLCATIESSPAGKSARYRLTPKPERVKPASQWDDDIFYGYAEGRDTTRIELYAWLRRAAGLAYDRAETALRRAAHVPVEVERLLSLR